MTNQEKLGLKVIELLNLKQDKKGLVKTQWGNKTPLGLGIIISDLLIEVNYKTLTNDERLDLIGMTDISTGNLL